MLKDTKTKMIESIAMGIIVILTLIAFYKRCHTFCIIAAAVVTAVVIVVHIVDEVKTFYRQIIPTFIFSYFFIDDFIDEKSMIMPFWYWYGIVPEAHLIYWVTLAISIIISIYNIAIGYTDYEKNHTLSAGRDVIMLISYGILFSSIFISMFTALLILAARFSL